MIHKKGTRGKNKKGVEEEGRRGTQFYSLNIAIFTCGEASHLENESALKVWLEKESAQARFSKGAARVIMGN